MFLVVKLLFLMLKRNVVLQHIADVKLFSFICMPLNRGYAVGGQLRKTFLSYIFLCQKTKHLCRKIFLSRKERYWIFFVKHIFLNLKFYLFIFNIFFYTYNFTFFIFIIIFKSFSTLKHVTDKVLFENVCIQDISHLDISHHGQMSTICNKHQNQFTLLMYYVDIYYSINFNVT